MAKSFAATPPAYQSTADPQPLVIDGPNVWNGFITNLSDLLTFDVGLRPTSTFTSGLLVYPNPTDGTFALHLGSDWRSTMDLSVYDYTGRVVFRQTDLRSSSGYLQLELKDLVPGVYYGSVTGQYSGRFSFIKH